MGDTTMRVMVLVKATKDSEAGVMPIEIRPLFEAPDFGDAMTPEVAEQEARIRDKAAGG